MTEYALQERAALSPMVSTIAFQQFRQNVQTNLVGLAARRPSDLPVRQRDKGVQGRNASWHDVMEATVRGAWHTHASRHGGLTPVAFANVADETQKIFVETLGRDSTLKELAEACVDTQIQATLPLVYHVVAIAQRVLKVAKRRDGAAAIPDMTRRVPFTPEERARHDHRPASQLRTALAHALLAALSHAEGPEAARRAANDARVALIHRRNRAEAHSRARRGLPALGPAGGCGEAWFGELPARIRERAWLRKRQQTRLKQIRKLTDIAVHAGPLDKDLVDLDARWIPDDALRVYLDLCLATPFEDAAAKAEALWHQTQADASRSRADVAAQRNAFFDTQRRVLSQHDQLVTAVAELDARRRVVQTFGGLDPYAAPTLFQHHAYLTVANRHLHQCMRTCTKYLSGKSGCRLRMPRPHDVPHTSISQLVELGPQGGWAEDDAWPLHDGTLVESDVVRCRQCYTQYDGTVHATDARRGVNYCLRSQPEAQAAPPDLRQHTSPAACEHVPVASSGASQDAAKAQIITGAEPPVDADASDTYKSLDVPRPRRSAGRRKRSRHHALQDEGVARLSDLLLTDAGDVHASAPVFSLAPDHRCLALDLKRHMVCTETRLLDALFPFSDDRDAATLTAHRDRAPTAIAAASGVKLQRVLRAALLDRDMRYVLERADSQLDALRARLYELRDAKEEELDERPAGATAQHGSKTEDLRALVRALCDGPLCLNGHVAEYNLVESGCGRTNQNPQHLGAGSGAMATDAYRGKYMAKGDDEPQEVLSLIATSSEIALKYPSTADDRLLKPEERHTKHFCAKMVNNCGRELDAVQAAAVVSGRAPLSMRSHMPVYVSVWAHVAVRKQAIGRELLVGRPHVDSTALRRLTRKATLDKLDALSTSELKAMCVRRGLPTTHPMEKTHPADPSETPDLSALSPKQRKQRPREHRSLKAVLRGRLREHDAALDIDDRPQPAQVPELDELAVDDEDKPQQVVEMKADPKAAFGTKYKVYASKCVRVVEAGDRKARVAYDRDPDLAQRCAEADRRGHEALASEFDAVVDRAVQFASSPAADDDAAGRQYHLRALKKMTAEAVRRRYRCRRALTPKLMQTSFPTLTALERALERDPRALYRPTYEQVVVCDAEHYGFRDERLKSFTADEFAQHCEIRKARCGDIEDNDFLDRWTRHDRDNEPVDLESGGAPRDYKEDIAAAHYDMIDVHAGHVTVNTVKTALEQLHLPYIAQRNVADFTPPHPAHHGRVSPRPTRMCQYEQWEALPFRAAAWYWQWTRGNLWDGTYGGGDGTYDAAVDDYNKFRRAWQKEAPVEQRHTTWGRRLVQRFGLRAPHPLARTHFIVWRACARVVQLTGPPPPKLGESPTPAGRDQFFSYLAALHVPWIIPPAPAPIKIRLTGVASSRPTILTPKERLPKIKATSASPSDETVFTRHYANLQRDACLWTRLEDALPQYRQTNGLHEVSRHALAHGSLVISCDSVAKFYGDVLVRDVNASADGSNGRCELAAAYDAYDPNRNKDLVADGCKGRVGDAITTAGGPFGSLMCSAVVHAHAPYRSPYADLRLQSSYDNALRCARHLGAHTIACPLLSASTRGTRTLRRMADIAVEAVARSAYHGLEVVLLVARDVAEERALATAARQYFSRAASVQGSTSVAAGAPAALPTTQGRPEPAWESAARRRQLTQRKIAHGRLFRIHSLCGGVEVPARLKALLNVHGRRARRLWKDTGPPEGGLDLEDTAEKAARREAAKLRTQIAALSDETVVKQRTNAAAEFCNMQARLAESLPSLPSDTRVANAHDLAAARPLFRAAVDATTRKNAPAEPRRGAHAIVAELLTPATPKPPLRPPDPTGTNPSSQAQGAMVDVETPALYQILTKAEWRRAFESWERTGAGPPPLNPEQRVAAAAAFRLAQYRNLARARGMTAEAIHHALAEEGLTGLMFVTGPGGVRTSVDMMLCYDGLTEPPQAGKSEMVKSLAKTLKDARAGYVVISAHTGAACAPFLTATINTMFKLGRDGHKKACVAHLGQSQVEDLRTKFLQECGVIPEDMALLVLDEVSHIEAGQLGHVDNLLRLMLGVPNIPFGGVPVLLAGDFQQLDPPGQGSKSMAHLLAEGAPRHINTAASRGLDAFASALRYDLTINMRGKRDEAFVKWLDGMRQGKIDPRGLSRIAPLSRDDARDPSWMFAPVGVKSNFERHIINNLQIRRFAQHFGLPLIRWPVRLVSSEGLAGASDVDALRAAEPNLWEYWVCGAPAVLRLNMSSRRGLCNNAPCLLDRLDFGERGPPEELVRAYRVGGYQEVVLSEPPKACLVRVGSAPARATSSAPPSKKRRRATVANDPAAYFWHGRRLPDLSSVLPRDVVDEVDAQIVPLVMGSSHRRTVKTISLLAVAGCVPREMETTPFPYELAFALTDYKLQGLSLAKLFLNLPRISDTRLNAMTFQGWYVLTSRGVMFDSLRWLQCDAQSYENLAYIRPPASIVAWNRAYVDRKYDHATCVAELGNVEQYQKTLPMKPRKQPRAQAQIPRAAAKRPRPTAAASPPPRPAQRAARKAQQAAATDLDSDVPPLMLSEPSARSKRPARPRTSASPPPHKRRTRVASPMVAVGRLTEPPSSANARPPTVPLTTSRTSSACRQPWGVNNLPGAFATRVAGCECSSGARSGLDEREHYHLRHGRLVVSYGSIVDFQGDVIVNAANKACITGGGVDGAITAAGGPRLKEARSKLRLVASQTRCHVGDAVITEGGPFGALQTRNIVHAVGPDYTCIEDEAQADALLASAYACAMRCARRAGARTIAFSLLSAGVFRGQQSLASVLSIAVQAIARNAYPGLDAAHLVAYGRAEKAALTAAASAYFPRSPRN